MFQFCQDSYAVAAAFGPKSDLFITVTANPQWEDIQVALLPGHTGKGVVQIPWQLGGCILFHQLQVNAIFLRMLLTHVKGPPSFEALHTVNGVVHHTFKSACLALGLLGDDEEW